MPRIRQPSRTRRSRPDKVHADKAHDVREHRWVVERTHTWLTNGYRRLTGRWERLARNHLARTTLICFKNPHATCSKPSRCRRTTRAAGW
ncbi:transposase [Actinokineospora inagensis]|uniref:transposase n=1 Tax=Actinokineospora inagensis TaxID=103730 RepID=UPI00146FB000